MDTHKTCIDCKIEKSVDQFYRSYTYKGKTVYKGECRDCNKKRSVIWSKKNPTKRYNNLLKHLYGISLKEYESMLLSQNGKCKICDSDKPGDKNQKYFNVDHDHKTGEVRGLLCQLCNAGLGYFKDNKNSLAKAIIYLGE